MTIKKWLKDNEIFFSTIASVSLAVMSIIVSITANNIAYKNLNLLEIDSLPFFVCQHSYYKVNTLIGYTTDTREEVYGDVNFSMYKIINKGGKIKDVTLHVNDYLIIVDDNGNNIGIPIYGLRMPANFSYDDNEFIVKPIDSKAPLPSSMKMTFKEISSENDYGLEFYTLMVGELNFTDYSGKQSDELIFIETPSYPDYNYSRIQFLSDISIDSNEFLTDKYKACKEVIDKLRSISIISD